MRIHVHTTVEGRLIERAKENRLNVSKVLEDALIEKVNQKTVEDLPKDKFTDEEYELIRGGFKNEPKDNLTWFYFINPHGEMQRRGEPLFFVNLHGKVREIDYKTWKLMRQITGEGKEKKKKESKLGDTYPHLD